MTINIARNEAVELADRCCEPIQLNWPNILSNAALGALRLMAHAPCILSSNLCDAGRSIRKRFTVEVVPEPGMSHEFNVQLPSGESSFKLRVSHQISGNIEFLQTDPSGRQATRLIFDSHNNPVAIFKPRSVRFTEGHDVETKIVEVDILGDNSVLEGDELIMLNSRLKLIGNCRSA